MALQRPKSMDKLAYYSRRSIDNGKVEVWVFKESCPECKTGVPRKLKLRASTYNCDCGAKISKEEYENILTASISYTCPKCNKSGETQVPFKRKKITIFDEVKQKKIRVDALTFECEFCNEKINITKKMK